ncbi:MAG: hypothetical protein NTZ61_06140 [Proteobacteria bacterium]|nr:hypothetical protein [Pseudomonadota bacterium]
MSRSGFALICILGVASAAQADFSVYSSVSGQVGDGTVDPLPFSQSSFAVQFPEAAFPMQAAGGLAFGTAASGSATATTTFGTLQASSSASAGVLGAQASTGGNARTDDTLHVQSSTLANGTPVSLSVVFSLLGNISLTTDPVYANGKAVAYAKVDASTGHVGGGLHLYYDPAVDGVLPLVLSGSVAAQVGDTISLTYRIDTLTQANFPSAEAPGGDAGAGIDGSFGITVDGATPDVTLTADSGYDYTQTVPEASAAASLGAALVSLLGICVVRVRGGRV